MGGGHGRLGADVELQGADSGFSDSVKFLGTKIGYEEVTIGRLVFERRAWGMRLRWSELWGTLKVITILGLLSGIWLFPWGWILLAFFFVYVFFVPSMIVHFLMFLVFGGPLAFISSILLLFVSMSEYHRGILGFFALVGSLVPLVLTLYLLAALIIKPIRFSIWPLLETGPVEMRSEQSE